MSKINKVGYVSQLVNELKPIRAEMRRWFKSIHTHQGCPVKLMVMRNLVALDYTAFSKNAIKVD